MIKIDIVSGFLGAGKTTFIKKLLKEYSGENIVIIENEFGDIGIDGEILEREGYKMFEISTGCICCLMQGDFIETIQNIIADIKPDRIIIEPTGISILSDILRSLKKEPILRSCLINSLITIIDCESYLDQSNIFGEFFSDQITYATRLVFSKIERASDEDIQEIIASVRMKNQDAPIVVKDWSSFDAEDINGYLNGSLIWDYSKELVVPGRRSCREGRFMTFSKETGRELTLQNVREKLDLLNGGGFGKVLRGKGFVKCVEGSFEFSCANARCEIYPLDYEVSGRICFIGLELKDRELDLLWEA